jgi:hypothetical protein
MSVEVYFVETDLKVSLVAVVEGLRAVSGDVAITAVTRGVVEVGCHWFFPSDIYADDAASCSWWANRCADCISATASFASTEFARRRGLLDRLIPG